MSRDGRTNVIVLLLSVGLGFLGGWIWEYRIFDSGVVTHSTEKRYTLECSNSNFYQDPTELQIRVRDHGSPPIFATFDPKTVFLEGSSLTYLYPEKKENGEYSLEQFYTVLERLYGDGIQKNAKKAYFTVKYEAIPAFVSNWINEFSLICKGFGIVRLKRINPVPQDQSASSKAFRWFIAVVPAGWFVLFGLLGFSWAGSTIATDFIFAKFHLDDRNPAPIAASPQPLTPPGTPDEALAEVPRNEAWRKPTGLRFLEQLKRDLIIIENRFLQQYAWQATSTVSETRFQMLQLKNRIEKIFAGVVEDDIVELDEKKKHLELERDELNNDIQANGKKRQSIINRCQTRIREIIKGITSL